MKLWRFIAVSLVSLAMGVSVTMLERTEWAAHVRARSRLPPSMAELQSMDSNPPQHVNYASPILKVSVFMGVPGVITLAAVKLVRQTRRKTGDKAIKS